MLLFFKIIFQMKRQIRICCFRYAVITTVRTFYTENIMIKIIASHTRSITKNADMFLIVSYITSNCTSPLF